ncbi:TPA: DUF1441 family protein [Escherichia coli]|nr:DUF1441 family protein [Escherichia coli]
MDRELKNLTLNISQLAALSGVHRQTAAARLQNLPVAGGHESNLKLYRVVDIVSAFLALPPPVAEGEMDAHERKAWYQSERERLKFEQETAQLIPASDVRREFAIWAKAVVQVLETLPDILERDCGLQPAAVSRVQSIIDDLRDQIALRVTEAGADDEEELQQLVLQARLLLLPLHQPTVKKQQKPVKPMQRQARLQRRTRRKHRQQARWLQKQVKTQPESMQARQQSRINMSYSHCLMCGYRLMTRWI